MNMKLQEKLQGFGVGRKKVNDSAFIDDGPPVRLGVYDADDENLCHDIVNTVCSVPGCKYSAESLLEFENHYNSSHRYTCSQCKKILPSPHLLDLHVQENHDSYFAVMAERKPSYCCLIEECKEKFMNQDERFEHCVRSHRLPKDFRFEQKPKAKRRKKGNKGSTSKEEMDVDDTNTNNTKDNLFLLKNSKTKMFQKYSGRKFTDSKKSSGTDVNMETLVDDLKQSLPE